MTRPDSFPLVVDSVNPDPTPLLHGHVQLELAVLAYGMT